MAADFPENEFNPRAVVNRAGVVYNAADLKTFFAEDFRKIRDEIQHIEEYLQKPYKYGYGPTRRVHGFKIIGEDDGGEWVWDLPSDHCPEDICVYCNGLRLQEDLDYTFDGTTIRLIDSNDPNLQTIYVDYWSEVYPWS